MHLLKPEWFCTCRALQSDCSRTAESEGCFFPLSSFRLFVETLENSACVCVYHILFTLPSLICQGKVNCSLYLLKKVVEKKEI